MPSLDRDVDRREYRRYPVSIPVTYRGVRQSGTGETANMSSHGILVLAEQHLRTGVGVYLSLSWPFSLDGAVALQLYAKARVVRCDPRWFAVAFTAYEFKTAKRATKIVLDNRELAAVG